MSLHPQATVRQMVAELYRLRNLPGYALNPLRSESDRLVEMEHLRTRIRETEFTVRWWQR